MTIAVILGLLANVGRATGSPHCFLPGSDTPTFFSSSPLFLLSTGGGSEGAATEAVGVVAAPAAAAALC